VRRTGAPHSARMKRPSPRRQPPPPQRLRCELEIQKIAYFLQVLGQPLKLSFTRGLYGPYAEQLHHVLQDLGGHYLIGYGDRTSKVRDLRPICLTNGSAAEAEEWVRVNDEEAQGRVEAFLKLADGYETPYSLSYSLRCISPHPPSPAPARTSL
jgi:hypothetical protein